MGFEPMLSTLRGWRPLRTGPPGHLISYPHSAECWDDPRFGKRGYLAIRGEGFEPPLPGSKPGGLPLADPRDRRPRVACFSGSFQRTVKRRRTPEKHARRYAAPK